MSDIKRPALLTVLALVIFILGFFEILFGAFPLALNIKTADPALLENSMQLTTLIFNAVKILIGLIGMASGIAVLRNKRSGISIMKKYAFASIIYQIVFVTYQLSYDSKIRWEYIVASLTIIMIILYFLITNDKVKNYSESLIEPLS